MSSRRRFLSKLAAAGTLVICEKGGGWNLSGHELSMEGENAPMQANQSSGKGKEIRLMILDPGHFHAALVQRSMYPEVSSVVYVYAPDGPELKDYLNRVRGFNSRGENPTRWDMRVYTGPDFLGKMLKEMPGNVMVTAGNNQRKAEYIQACVDAGIHVFSDKPMCIDREGFQQLKKAFESARKNKVLLYDIMTERFEITTILQKELIHIPEFFGRMELGTLESPAVTKESVHHFYKIVSGKPVQRPAWFVDVRQQGEGIVDVSTHLVDLVMWACFPGEIIRYPSEVKMLKARRWPTLITREQYTKMTGLPDFAGFLRDRMNPAGQFPCYCNGEMVYTLRGVHSKVSVIWNFEAPSGAGDTHYSIMRGTKANVIIEQGSRQNYRPELYCEAAPRGNKAALGESLRRGIDQLQQHFPGIAIESQGDRWRILIPDHYRVGHEAHFGQVMQNYLQYLQKGSLPAWEVPNMIAKYHTTTQALDLALKTNS
jgi:predicted dehydrogenase